MRRGRLRRGAPAAVCAVLALIGVPAAAEAVVLISPPEGATAPSTPTFDWQLEPGEESEAIEYSTNPAPGSSGGFAEDRQLTFDVVRPDQTTYTVGNTRPLVAGQWYWHVRVAVPGEFFPESRWSATQSFFVADERARIESAEIEYLSCSRVVTVQFEHSDNSDVAPRFAVEFRSRGRRVARRSLGQTDSPGLGGSTEFASFRRPRKVRVGRRYVVRLLLIDSARHVTRSQPRRLRIDRC